MKTSKSKGVWFKFILLGTLIMSVFACKKKQVKEPAPDMAGIYEVVEAQKQAWNKGDIDGFCSYYDKSEEILFVTTRGVTRGYTAIVNRYKSAYDSPEKMGKLHFDSLELVPIGQKAAVLKGNWFVYRTEDTLSGIFSTVFRHRNGEWKMIYDHTN